MSISKYEQETSLWYNNAETEAICYTYNKKLMNKLDKYCIEYPKNYKLKREVIIDGEKVGKEYIFSKQYISIRKPSSRIMSEDQKLAASIRLKKNRSKNQE
jgi:hypothetical protein